MTDTIELGDVVVDVVKKDIKNVHLSVYPPEGRVRISAPSGMSLDAIRSFAVSKLGWIRQQQSKLRDQERETPREYLDNESHYLWGKRYLLEVAEQEAAPHVAIEHGKLVLRVRPGADVAKRQAVIGQWYRQHIKNNVPALTEKWEPVIGVKVANFFVRQMKTKWGSCNPEVGSIRLNSELAKKPPECLEYVVVHEMVHLLEHTHNGRFVALMDRFMPQWKYRQAELNRAPLKHEAWPY